MRRVIKRTVTTVTTVTTITWSDVPEDLIDQQTSETYETTSIHQEDITPNEPPESTHNG